MMLNCPEIADSAQAIGDHQDVLPCVLPFFHIYGFTVTMISKLALGCKLVTLASFHPETYLNVLEKHKGNVLYLVPPIGEITF
jgi:4-coumarate--CoA ligase